MRFWDSSAVVPLTVREASTDRLLDHLRDDPAMAVWVATPVEVLSALWRRRRGGEVTDALVGAAGDLLDALERAWSVVADATPVVARARRLVAVHPLRAADALQLAAALFACREDPSQVDVVTLDDRLAAAARLEGFHVLP